MLEPKSLHLNNNTKGVTHDKGLVTRNYLGTFLSRCDVYVHIDVTMATEFCQSCFPNFAFFLKIGRNSIVINGVIILHLN